jgi:ribonuclease HI
MMIVIQHNCNTSAVSMTAALEAAIERGAEVACLQEPYIGKKYVISHPGYQIRWPECEKKDIRVALAIRVDVLDRYIFEERTDLINSPYIQCLDIWETQHRRKVRCTRLINIYNKARMEEGGYTIDRINLSRLIEGRTILAGDFNARSPAWDPWAESRRNAGTTEQLIERHGLILNNNDQPTRRGRDCQSIIDLTLSTSNVGHLEMWEMDENLATPSDHEVIVFSWSPLQTQEIDGEQQMVAGWNVDKLRANKEQLEQAHQHWIDVAQNRQLLGTKTTTAELEAEAHWIQASLTAVLDTYARREPVHARSKRWWTAEIKLKRSGFCRARRDFSHSRLPLEDYRSIRNEYYRCIRRAKREAWECFLEGIFPTDEDAQHTPDSERCWKALRYTKPHVPSYTPAITITGNEGLPDKIAATAEEKENVFMNQGFPPQTSSEDDIDIPDTTVQIKADDVRKALFAQSVKKAPGADGISFKALRLLWQWDEERVMSLVQGCITHGYHPCTWKTAKGILLRKPDKPTYTVAKAYRVISLLSCLGKVVEKVVATWIASFCERTEVFHQGQFGCRQGMSTSDAIAQLVSKVEDAWNQKQTVLALLLDVKGAFDRVNKQRLLQRMLEVGIAGNIVRWVQSFLSDRRAMLVIDGRTGETQNIQAGLPQGSPASPVLFILSISALFSWLEARHARVQAISFVDDICLAIHCDNLEKGTKELEQVAQDAISWGMNNKVDFEVSKTEVILFSKQRKMLQAARGTRVHIGKQSFPINQGATRWLGFWLDPKLSFKTHFEKRLVSAKGAMQRISGLSRRNGGLSLSLMRRVVLAAVSSIALYGAEVWWRGQKDKQNLLQLLLNSQARSITGMLKSTPIAALLEAARVQQAVHILDHRQTRYAVRALAAPQDHPTHQILPANFRLGELYRHEGATGHLSSVGWRRLDKTHRSFGSRLAQQVARLVTYDTEYGFDLLEKQDHPEIAVEVRTDLGQALQVSIEPLDQITLFTDSAEGPTFGAGIAWKEDNHWKTKTTPLGRYLTILEAELFAIHMAIREARPAMTRTDHRRLEIRSDSQQALKAIANAGHWTLPVIKNIYRQIGQMQANGDTIRLSWVQAHEGIEGNEISDIAAKRAARQQPREMRSASLSYVMKCVGNKWQRSKKLNKHIGNGKKSVTTRYLQLKSGHAVTGVHLLKIKRAQDTQCWWCDNSRQDVAHLMLHCRRWRRERDTMLKELQAAKIRISARKDGNDLQTLFGDDAVQMVLRFVEGTAVGRKSEADDVGRLDEWDIDQLDREGDGE